MREQIKLEIEKRGITRLCHFTNSRSFIHIIQNDLGVVANNFLGDEEEIGIMSKNDNLRLDGKEDYISCSIEYPNTWYLDKVKLRDPNFRDWVVLFIDPLVMLEENTLFCHRNAAAGEGKYLKSGNEGLRGMFAQTVDGKFKMNRAYNMLSCCPTDGQAEVMVYKNIPKESIKGVCVSSMEQVKIEMLKISHLNLLEGELNFDWIISPELFSTNWTKSVKMGKRPSELFLEKE